MKLTALIFSMTLLFMPAHSAVAKDINPILGSAKMMPVSKEASKKITAKGAVANYYGNLAQTVAWSSYYYAYYGYVYGNSSYYYLANSYAYYALQYTSYAYILTLYGI